MRTYFFGDIHGNEYALEACLKHSQQVKADEIYCLGDLGGCPRMDGFNILN